MNSEKGNTQYSGSSSRFPLWGSWKGLGVFSAQAFEAVHPDFLETYQRFKVDPEHKDYGKKFKASVCNYDSFHVCDY